jgi:hypothetical protein
MSAAKQHANFQSTNITTPQATCIQMTAKRPNKTTVCVLTLKKLHGPDTNQTSIKPLIYTYFIYA